MSPGYGHRVVLASEVARAGPELPVPSQASSNDSEATPRAAATPRCRRQSGNAYGKQQGREGRIPGRPLGEVAKGQQPGGSLFRAADTRRVGDLLGQMTGKREERTAAHLSLGTAEQKVALLQWYPLEMGGIAGALEGFGEMCPRGRERDAIAAGRCLELDALSDRGEKTPGHLDTWAILRPGDVSKPGKLGSLGAGRVATFGLPAAACGESGVVGGAARPRPLASGLAAAVRSPGYHW